MVSAEERLVSLSDGPIDTLAPDLDFLLAFGDRGRELRHLLGRLNGFYALDRALLVRPASSRLTPLGIIEWNRDELWKCEYEFDLSESLFFAEDIFGLQICIREERIQRFDPETGLFAQVAPTLRDWAEELLTDTDYQTGQSLAQEWQRMHEPLPPGSRLLPKTPFVTGGEYEVLNLYRLNDVEGMKFRASIANQIRDLPDGGSIIFQTS